MPLFTDTISDTRIWGAGSFTNNKFWLLVILVIQRGQGKELPCFITQSKQWADMLLLVLYVHFLVLWWG